MTMIAHLVSFPGLPTMQYPVTFPDLPTIQYLVSFPGLPTMQYLLTLCKTEGESLYFITNQ